jgi:hypothetical protein
VSVLRAVATAACARSRSPRSALPPAWLLRRQQLGRETQTHRAAAVVPAIDRGASYVVAECFLLARASADIDQLTVGAGPLLDGSPRLRDAWSVLVVQPAAADAAA